MQHEQTVVAGAQHVQLAVGADVVDAGVGAGVGEEDEAFVEAEGHAVGHGGCLGRWEGWCVDGSDSAERADNHAIARECVINLVFTNSLWGE